MKSYNIKVYQKDGITLIKTLNYTPTQPTDGSKDEVLLSAPKFNAKKNGGLGACKLKFNLKFDDMGTLESVIVPMNEFKIYEINEDYPLGILIFSGFLDSDTPEIKGVEETVEVKLLGYASVLTFDEFRTAGGSSTVVYTATDPGQMARDIFTRAGELCPQITYDTSSIPLLGWTTDYTFENLTLKDSIDLVQKIAGVSFYWYLDQNNKAYFLEKASVAEKKYQIGHDIQNAKSEKKTDEIKNNIIFEWASGTITKTDTASITAYLKRTSRVNGASITSSAAADIQAQYILDSKKDLKTKVSIVLNNIAKFYDIRPGQTVKILGLKKDQTIFGDNMQIETINYTPDTMTLGLEEVKTLADDIKEIAETAEKF